MIKIKYTDSEQFIDISFYRDEHTVTLTGTTDVNTSGFETYRMDGETKLGDFSEFATVYRVGDDYIQYSDDGSVWVDPTPVPVVPDPTPTLEERINDLEMAICELADALSAAE